jgi:biotin operon repressor
MMKKHEIRAMVYALPSLTYNEFKALLGLLWCVHRDTLAGAVSADQLSKRMGISRRRILMGLSGLKKKGYIIRSAQRVNEAMSQVAENQINADVIKRDYEALASEGMNTSEDLDTSEGLNASEDLNTSEGSNTSEGIDTSTSEDIGILPVKDPSPLYRVTKNNEEYRREENLKGLTVASEGMNTSEGIDTSSLSKFQKRRENEKALNRMHALMWRHSAQDIGRNASRFAFRAVVESYLSERDIEPKDFNPSDYAVFWDENKTQLIERMQSS